jgi:methylmalonyl-CoA/ethylmalonyl-CoA epimerase
MLGTIGQIAMRAKDIDRATTFYADTLGIRLLFRAGTLSFFDCGGVRLMLSPPEGDFDHPGSVLYFKVADIDAVHATLVSRGVKILKSPHVIAKLPDHELWMSFFHDSEDNTLALMEERR